MQGASSKGMHTVCCKITGELALQAVQSLGAEGSLNHLLTQGWRGAGNQILGLIIGPQPMAVMPDIKVKHSVSRQQGRGPQRPTFQQRRWASLQAGT